MIRSSSPAGSAAWWNRWRPTITWRPPRPSCGSWAIGGVLNGVGGGMNYLGFSYDVGMHEVDCGQRDRPREVLFPCGAACAIKRSAFEEAGGFDDQFFMYHEDVDLGWRLHLLGYSVQTAPQSVVYHRFGGTSRRAAGAFFRERLGLRHDLRSLIKNYQWATLVRVLPHFLACLLKLTWATRSCRFLHCLGWNLLHLPGTLKRAKGRPAGAAGQRSPTRLADRPTRARAVL